MAVVRFLLKTLLSFIILVVLLVICGIGLAIWSFPKLAPKGIDSWIEGRTGFSATVNSVNLKVFSGKLDIEGVTLVNPPYYQNKNFMQINEFLVQMEPRSLLRDRVVFEYVIVDIDRITWVKNGQGTINVIEFFDKIGKKRKSSKRVVVEGGEEHKDSTGARSGRDYIIKKLVVKVGEIDMVGFVSENDAQSFPLNFNQEFTDVTDVEAIVHQLVADFTANGALNLAQSLLGLPSASGALGSKVVDGVQKGVEKVFRLLQNATK